MREAIFSACPSLRFAKAVRFLDEPLPLYKALGPGERWITVRPPGHDKGTPVLIREHPDGTATVIGGAGGSMNHLKLRGVQPQGSYRQALRDKAEARRAERKAQVAKDKESGVHEQKQALKKELRSTVKKARQDFIAAVAEAAGWSEKDMAFDEDAHSGLSPEALKKARAKHEAGLFARARKAADVNRRMLVADSDARAEAGLGELPLRSEDADALAAADLDPMPEKAPALGFSTDYKGRAEKHGLTQDALDAAIAQVSPKTPEQIEAAREKKIAAEAIAKELAEFEALNPDSKLPSPRVLENAKDSAKMVRAYKRLRMLEQAARQQSSAIDAAAIPESKAAVLEVSDAEVEAAAAQEMEDDIATAGTRAFLLEADRLGGEAGLGGAVGLGAYNAINAVSMTVGGQALVDRSVVDVLGVEGAAQILARRLQADLSPDELENTRLAMADYHRADFVARQDAALAQAQELHDAAAAIEVPEAGDGFELAEAQEINARRRDAILEAKQVVGKAMGEMRANAALAMALGAAAPETLEVSLGKQSADSAVVQMYALGLTDEDFEIAPAGDNLVVTVNAQGLDRLAQPIDQEGRAQIKRNVEISEGKFDEDGWLPQGFARRPDLAMKLEPGVAATLAKPFTPGPDLQVSLRDYIGGRIADGDAISDVLADIQSADFVSKSGDPKAYRAALDAVAPLKGEDGKMRSVESLREPFEKYADDFVAERYGPDVSPLHRQALPVGDDAVDALHRALAKNPAGVAAYKAVGDLTARERGGLRDWWYANIAKESPEAGELRHKLESLLANEPTKNVTDMFGETAISPEWSQWYSQRQELAEKVNAASLTWSKYVDVMGSPTAAITAVQDLVRSHVTSEFARVYNTLRPDSPVKVGKTTIRGSLDHLDAVDPEARDARLAKQKALIDSLRERINGKYAAGSVSDKIQAAKEAQDAFEQSQMGFFSVEDAPLEAEGKETPLGADERFTMGHAADLAVAKMMSVVGKNFQPGRPSAIWQPSMDGKYIAQQRAVKHIVANRRTVLGYGAGSGKTAISLGAFTEMKARGMASRAIYLVPSVVQGQFGGEALRFLEPGKYQWSAQPGMSREQRIAAYKDPDNDFVVMTHQSFRDDMIYLGAQQAGISEKQMSEQLAGMTAKERASWSRALMESEGIKFDMSVVDEAHDTVNRAGKENSSLANVIDSVTDNTPNYVYMSGDVAKNDVSEAQDFMAKMDRERYGDRDAFMRKYGADALSSRQALKRELARHVISNTIDSGVEKNKQRLSLELSSQQKAEIATIDKAAARCTIAQMSGKVDLEAARKLSPALFEGVPEEDHEKVAAAVQKSASMIRSSAVRGILDTHESSPKFDAVVAQARQRKGKQGVVFARRRQSVETLRKRLEDEGFRVVTVTGSDSAADKDAKRLLFNPESGEAKADILVASDAAAVGMNLQSGQYLIQLDTPDTAKAHGQRSARIDRIGQKQNIDLIDLAIDHPSEQRAYTRLQKKYALREFLLDPIDGLDDTGFAHFLRQRSLAAHQAQETMF